MKRFVCLFAVFLAGTSVAWSVDFYQGAFSGGNSEFVASYYQRFVTAKNRHSSFDKVKSNPAAGGIAYQYHNGDQWTAGLSISYEQGDIKAYSSDWNAVGYRDIYNKLTNRNLGFTVFGKMNLFDGWYVKGSGHLGFNWLKLKHNDWTQYSAAGGYLGQGGDYYGRGNRSSTQFGLSLEGGKAFVVGDGFIITPHAGIDYSYTPKARIKVWDAATGFDNTLSIAHQNYFELPIGVMASKDFCAGDWTITPSVDLTVVPAVGNIKSDNMNYRTGFASFTGSDWKAYGVGGDHWGGRVSAGVKADMSKRAGMELKYAYEGRRKYDDHRLMLSGFIRF